MNLLQLLSKGHLNHELAQKVNKMIILKNHFFYFIRLKNNRLTKITAKALKT
jgi:hypothetical protein